jgi:hypothetical protein
MCILHLPVTCDSDIILCRDTGTVLFGDTEKQETVKTKIIVHYVRG